MEDRNITILFLVCLIPFLFFFSSERFADPDSYYYLNAICHDSSLRPVDWNVFNWFVDSLPCNVLFLKALVFLVFFGIVLTTAKLGELFDKENGWLVGLVLTSLTLFMTEAWKFENDLFGYFFGFLALYFLARHFECYGFTFSQSKDLFLGICFAIVGGLFWQGIAYWLMVFAFLTPYVFPLLIGILVYRWETFFGFLIANKNVGENLPWLGLGYLGLTLLFGVGVLKTKKWIAWSFALMLIPLTFQSKLFVLGLPFACLVCFEGIKMLSQSIETKFGYKNIFDIAKNSLIFFALMVGVLWGQASLQQFPLESDLNLVQHAVNISPRLENDFSAGYLIEYYGGTPSCKGWVCEYKNQGYVIQLAQTPTTCTILRTSDTLQLTHCPQVKSN